VSSAKAIARFSNREWKSQVSGETSSFGQSSITTVNELTSFDLASVTKVLCTTTLVLRAVDSGLIRISDEVRDFIPELNTMDKANITVEDLLRHESGMEEWRPFYISCSDKEQVLAQIAALPLKYPKQKEFHYSDLNFMLLGAVLTKVFGVALDRIFATEIAQPLGLKNTQFAAPFDLSNVAATSNGDSIEYKMVSTKSPYSVPEQVSDFNNWRHHVLSGEVNDGNAFHVFKGISGHAGLFSTLQDLKIYATALLDEFIDFNSLINFSQPRSSTVQGIGFRRFALKDGGFAMGHFGFTGTGFAIDLEQDRSWIYLSNRLHTTENYRNMNEIWCEEFKEFSFPG
jgi:CubicO group peptidase (beta-lactamase class C family)